MRSELKAINNGTATIDVYVAPEEYRKEKNNLYKQVRNSIDISGFRKGKVPLKMAERILGSDFLDQSLSSELIDKNYDDIFRNVNIRVLSNPYILDYYQTEDDGFIINLELATNPEVEIPNILELLQENEHPFVNIEDVEVLDDEVNDYINSIKEEFEISDELTDEIVKDNFYYDSLDEFKDVVKNIVRAEKFDNQNLESGAEVLNKLIENAKVTFSQYFIEETKERDSKNGLEQDNILVEYFYPKYNINDSAYNNYVNYQSDIGVVHYLNDTLGLGLANDELDRYITIMDNDEPLVELKEKLDYKNLPKTYLYNDLIKKNLENALALSTAVQE